MRRKDQATHRTRERQRGLTLIELMIAMLISSILVGFMFGTYTRMSTAYRAQTSIGEVQQRLRLAKELIVRDMRPAGNLLAQGFAVNPAVDATSIMDLRNPVPPVFTQTGGGSTPDTISVFYADTTIGTAIEAPFISDTEVNVKNAAAFFDVRFREGNQLAVIIRPSETTTNPNGIVYFACVVRITNDPDNGDITLKFDTAGAPYNSATNDHCRFADPPISGASIIAPGSMIYAFAARGYRIDPTRPTAGVLQRSMTGGIADDGIVNDWEDIGLGFTDLQVARRYVEPGDITDSDLELDENGNADPTLDWFSGPDDDPPPAGVTLPIDTALLTEIGISLTGRTIRQIDGSGGQSTPELSLPGNPHHNPIGDSPAIPLAGQPIFSRPLAHQGNYVYRSTSVRIDIRNQMATRGEFLKRL